MLYGAFLALRRLWSAPLFLIGGGYDRNISDATRLPTMMDYIREDPAAFGVLSRQEGPRCW
jgi:hypothetical protein